MPPLRQRIETDRSNIIMAAKRPDVRAEWGRDDSNLRKVSPVEKSGMHIYFSTIYAHGSRSRRRRRWSSPFQKQRGRRSRVRHRPARTKVTTPGAATGSQTAQEQVDTKRDASVGRNSNSPPRSCPVAESRRSRIAVKLHLGASGTPSRRPNAENSVNGRTSEGAPASNLVPAVSNPHRKGVEHGHTPNTHPKHRRSRTEDARGDRSHRRIAPSRVRVAVEKLVAHGRLRRRDGGYCKTS
jgi:hypothetical protein